jgi:hypothetical protein
VNPSFGLVKVPKDPRNNLYTLQQFIFMAIEEDGMGKGKFQIWLMSLEGGILKPSD